MGRYSNPSLQIRQVQFLLHMTPDSCPVAVVPSRQKQHRLHPEEIEKLIAEYHQTGTTAPVLAALHGVQRKTVLQILKRNGVTPRYRVLTPELIQQAIVDYEAGSSLAVIARPLGVDPGTIWNALKKAGVQMRRPNQKAR